MRRKRTPWGLFRSALALFAAVLLTPAFSHIQDPPVSDVPFDRDPLRQSVVIPPGRYLVTRPVRIDPGQATIGGKVYHTRGWGPIVDMRGVVLVAAPEFQGDSVLEVVGTHPIILGGMIDGRWRETPYGARFLAKVVDGKSEASGGRGSWTGGGILGRFSVAALYLEGAEEIAFRDFQVINQGTGLGVHVANDRLLPGWSQTVTLFDGCSFQIYGNDAVKLSGIVNDTAFVDCFFATAKDVVDASELTGRRNYLVRCRVECHKDTVIVKGASSSAAFSRGNAVKSVSPLVSAFKALPPQTLGPAERAQLLAWPPR